MKARMIALVAAGTVAGIGAMQEDGRDAAKTVLRHALGPVISTAHACVPTQTMSSLTTTTLATATQTVSSAGSTAASALAGATSSGPAPVVLTPPPTAPSDLQSIVAAVTAVPAAALPGSAPSQPGGGTPSPSPSPSAGPAPAPAASGSSTGGTAVAGGSAAASGSGGGGGGGGGGVGFGGVGGVGVGGSSLLAGALAPDDAVTSGEARDETSSSEYTKPVVLVVTSAGPELDRLSRQLTGAGYAVRLAADVEQALRAVPSYEPVAILVASSLPGIERLRGVESGKYRRVAAKEPAADAGFEVLAVKWANVEALGKAIYGKPLLATLP